jgi:hypothetical protein
MRLERVNASQPVLDPVPTVENLGHHPSLMILAKDAAP